MRYQVDGVDILINPNINILLNFIENTKTQAGRGLFDGKNIYVWDAYYLAHTDAAKELGIELYSRVVITGPENSVFNLTTDDKLGIKSNTYFKKILESKEIKIQWKSQDE